jgi:hypothetical protein
MNNIFGEESDEEKEEFMDYKKRLSLKSLTNVEVSSKKII